MPLGTNLAADIQAVFDSSPASPHDAAVGLAQAYYDYVKASTFPPDAPQITTGMRDTMAGVLEVSLAVPGLPITHAAAWAAAVAAFWIAPPPAVLGPLPGVCNGCPGAAALTGIAAVLLNLANTSATAAAGIAALLIAATITTTATLIFPPPTAVPIL